MSNIDTKTTRNFSYGLFLLTAYNQNKHNGCIINTAIQLTSEPYKISIAVNKQNYTLEMICESKKFNISILSTKVKFDLFERFGFKSGRDVDKFDGFSCLTSLNGLKYLDGDLANAYLSAEALEFIELETHYLIIAKVVEAKVLSNDPSITYAYYFEHVKPKPQVKTQSGEVHACLLCGYEYIDDNEKVPFKELPNDWTCPLCGASKRDFEKRSTPTKKQNTNAKKVWVCSICGYVYDDNVEKIPFEELPSDWTCPLCKHPKSDFELQN